MRIDLLTRIWIGWAALGLALTGIVYLLHRADAAPEGVIAVALWCVAALAGFATQAEPSSLVHW